MGLSSLKGNGGFIGVDRRHSIVSGAVGNMSIRKYYLESRAVNIPPYGYGPGNDVTTWWDARSKSTLLSGSDIVRWYDRSGNDVDLLDDVVDRPIYNVSDVDFNGLPSTTFGNNQHMESIYNSLLDLDTGSGFTLYLVLKINSFPSTYSFLVTRTNGTSWTKGWGIMYFSNNWRFWVNNYNYTNTRVDMGSWSDFTNAHIFKLTYNKVNITGEIIGPSGVSEVNTAYTTAPKNPSSSEGIRLGDGNSSSYDCDFKLAEMVFYNRPINEVEQSEAEAYLKNKYNIS
jgi:hypothetical protein